MRLARFPTHQRDYAANEFMTLGHYIAGIKFAATIYAMFGEQQAGQEGTATKQSTDGN